MPTMNHEPSPYEKVPPHEFQWPCDKQRPHGKHDDCPGVQAHPATMAGTQYRIKELPF